MPFDRKDRWLQAYFIWLGSYLAIALVLGLAVAAWDRAAILPGDPGFVMPPEDSAP